ncbi:hypothetical protein B0T18DRAFT_395509 [Schizothecium vesticola]|uniref:Uncharacterized protein n=1 Tax=Schizothecium vesticola TaxID=314040 RepID=A0AA40KBI4_9PEZI|nr:hypothetical protein B0T18DRAFT_395509 [Schizothecium vesticola]
MARGRLAGWFALALIILHSLSLMACLADIGGTYNAVARGQVAGGEMLGTFVAALLTSGLDIAEIVALVDTRNKRTNRCPEKLLYLVELLTAMFCFIAPVCSVFAYTEMRYRRCRHLKGSERLQREDCKSLMGTYGPQDLPLTTAPALTFLAG